RLISVIWPTSMSLYLILVLPACRPSAVRKLMMMTLPRSSQWLTASQAPMASATAGTSHTSGSVRPERGAASACGMGSGGGALLMFLDRIPDQARIEAHRRHHRQHHHRAEGERRRAGAHGGERAELHHRDEQRDDEDVEHRPAADRFDQPIEARALRLLRCPGELHRAEPA